MDEVQDVLVCVGEHEEHTELSELDVCRDCGAQVWVSPSGRDMQREKNLKIICTECIPENGILAEPITLEQLLELHAHFRRN